MLSLLKSSFLKVLKFNTKTYRAFEVSQMLMVLFSTCVGIGQKRLCGFFPSFLYNFFFFLGGRGAWDKRMKGESRGNWILVGTAVPSCRNQGRNKCIVSGETK